MRIKDRKSKLSRLELTDGVNVRRQYAFAVILDPGDYGCYYSGQLVPLEWEGDNRPREVGIGRAKPGKMNATCEMFDDFFEAVDYARETQEIHKDYEKFENVCAEAQVFAREGSEGRIDLRWGNSHTDILTVGQAYDAMMALADVLPMVVGIKTLTGEAPVFTIKDGGVPCGLCGGSSRQSLMGVHESFPEREICLKCHETLIYIASVENERIGLRQYVDYKKKGGLLAPATWLGAVRDGTVENERISLRQYEAYKKRGGALSRPAWLNSFRD